MPKLTLPLLMLLLAGCAVATGTPEPTQAPAPTAAHTAAPTATPTPPPLIVDGFFEDWAAIEPLVRDPSGDGGVSGVDFTGIAVAHTGTDLLIYVTLGATVNLQSEPALALTLSAGGQELHYDFAARGGSAGGSPVTHAGLGLVTLPTTSSDRFEIAIRRDASAGGQPLFVDGAPVSIALADPNPGGDEVPAFSYTWDDPALPVSPLGVERPNGAVRLVSYNVERDGVLDSRRAEQFGRILHALQPDIIAFQEVNNRSAASVEARVEEWLGGDWFALKQADLVTVSRYPFIEGWADSTQPLDERVYALMVDVEGQPLLVFNAHLFCCGEDEGRQDQADGFAAFVRDTAPPGTPFVLAGDLNLVGRAEQLVTLLQGDILDEGEYGPDAAPDWDGTPLADLVPRHLFTAHTFTWRDAGSDFAPGRLDFVIYTDSLLTATGFVFDPAELPAAMLDALGVLPTDALDASDHLPLVVDLVFLP